MSRSEAPAPNWGWRSFWREDRLAACVPEHPESARAIAMHWSQVFDNAADGARILDVATGNGVVLTHAAAAGRAAGRRFALTGVDLADIDPLRFVPGLREQLSGATFIGGIRAERLPFAAASFDLVVSQYGLEYADLAQGLAEIGRVLAPGGALRWLAHGEDSIVVAQNRAQLDEIAHLLSPDGPFSAMRQLVRALTRQRGLDRAVSQLATALRAAERFCSRHPPANLVRQFCSSFVDIAHGSDRYRPADIEQMLDTNTERMRAHRQRIRDLIAARLTPVREAEVRALLRGPDWASMTCSCLTVGAGLDVGQIIAAERRS